MPHSARYEAHPAAAWCELLDSVDAVCAELKAAPLPALAVIARALREPPGLVRLPFVRTILAELRHAAEAEGHPRQ